MRRGAHADACVMRALRLLISGLRVCGASFAAALWVPVGAGSRGAQLWRRQRGLACSVRARAVRALCGSSAFGADAPAAFSRALDLSAEGGAERAGRFCPQRRDGEAQPSCPPAHAPASFRPALSAARCERDLNTQSNRGAWETRWIHCVSHSLGSILRPPSNQFLTAIRARIRARTTGGAPAARRPRPPRQLAAVPGRPARGEGGGSGQREATRHEDEPHAGRWGEARGDRGECEK